MRRRSFFVSPLAGFAQSSSAPPTVLADSDGIPHTPAEYASLLARLAPNVEPDNFSRSGVVEALERTAAAALGKETAVWFPTGTLANHLAIRVLAGPRRRVLVQSESHLYRDTGDCAQTLSGLHLIPLAPGKATFTLADVEAAASDAQLGRVLTPLGAIAIETPVRRRQGERFDFEEMTRIARWARHRGIGLHLDGARVFLEAAYTRRSVRDYAALFDTVYVSTYKYFNASAGAILAGPASLLEGMFHTRRMFGASLYQAWPCAAVALHYWNGFEDRFRRAVETSEEVISALSRDGNFEVQRVANGTNIFRLRTTGVNAPVYRQRLAEAGVIAPAAVDSVWLPLRVNETWSRIPAAEILARMRTALG